MRRSRHYAPNYILLILILTAVLVLHHSTQTRPIMQKMHGRVNLLDAIVRVGDIVVYWQASVNVP